MNLRAQRLGLRLGALHDGRARELLLAEVALALGVVLGGDQVGPRGEQRGHGLAKLIALDFHQRLPLIDLVADGHQHARDAPVDATAHVCHGVRVEVHRPHQLQRGGHGALLDLLGGELPALGELCGEAHVTGGHHLLLRLGDRLVVPVITTPGVDPKTDRETR
ncbi:MAG: hypothetical protein QM778_33605 [Myxococcales bacterium]